MYGGPCCTWFDSINLFDVDISPSCLIDQYLSPPRALASVVESTGALMESRLPALAVLILLNYDCGLK
jgi:hypothetical protein